METSMPPRLSPIPKVDYPSEELYRTIFFLTEGRIGVATDQPKDHVYLVKVSEASPGLDVRQTGFLENAMMIRGVFDIAGAENRRDLSRTYREMLDRRDVSWKREPREAGM